METIYLALSAQVAVGTFFMKSPVGIYLRDLTYFDFDIMYIILII